MYLSQEPAFVDPVVLDIVVCERKYMKLTVAEKRHAAHRLRARGLTPTQTGEIMRMTARTVARMLLTPPPPILDVDATGELVSVVGYTDNCD